MPLAHPMKVGQNIRLLMTEGKPYNQAIAIALHKKAKWEKDHPPSLQKVEDPPQEPQK